MDTLINRDLEVIIEGYEPFDLLRLSKEAFYSVANQYFSNIEILDMKLSFIVVGGEIAIKARIIDYKEEI